MLIKKIQNTEDEQTFELSGEDLKIINEKFEDEVTPLEVAIINNKFVIAYKLINNGAEITDQAFNDINIIIERTEILLDNCKTLKKFMEIAKIAKDLKTQ